MSQQDGLLSERQIKRIVQALMLGVLLSSLDSTVVSTAMRTIADDLHGQTMQAWATVAYLITASVSMPLYGKLSDIYGRKLLYLISISVFLGGSALCAGAQSVYQLAGCRAVQGLGAGGLTALAMAILADILPPLDRIRVQPYFMAAFGISSVAGPIVGGVFAGADSIAGIAGWRWVFLINLPLGAFALFMVATQLNAPHVRVNHRVDYLGAVALMVGTVPLLVVAERGREWGWASGLSLGMIALGVVGLILFVWVEIRMGDEALLPMSLFRGPVFRVGSALNVVVGVGMFGAVVIAPLYLQLEKGYSPTRAGLALVPLMFGVISGATAGSGVTAKTGRYKPPAVLGLAMMSAGLAMWALIGIDTPYWVVALIMVFSGLGLGLNLPILVLAVQNEVAVKDTGVATAAVTFFRQLGGTAGTALFLSVLFSILADRIAERVLAAAGTASFRSALADPAVQADPANRRVLDAIASGGGGRPPDLNDTTFLSGLDPRLARPFIEGFASALSTVFMVGAGVIAVAFVLSWFLPEKPLVHTSGMQERAAQDRAAREAREAAAAEADAV